MGESASTFPECWQCLAVALNVVQVLSVELDVVFGGARPGKQT